jgi:histidinol phosphatase-like PHP family hydrolase
MVDGMEVYNSNPRHEDFSERSEAVARENGLSMIGGSDAHRDEDVAGSGILTEEKIETAEQLIRLVKEHRCEIIRCA